MPGRRAGWSWLLTLTLGFGFLYAPIVLLVVYSFNASRLVTVWAGLSPRWYGALFHNEAFGAAALTSLEVATMAASLSLVFGTLAGFSMARFARFPGRPLFGFALLAPLVLPEVILGLSLLLLFVACQSWVGWPSRGMLTIIIAHATFGACFVSVLVRAQLAGFDRALEEAALDLGARPLTVLTRITLPGISPALVSGWLLAFTLSLGPGHRQFCHRPVCNHLADGGVFECAPRGQSGGQRARDIISGARHRIGCARRLADGAG